MPTKEGTFGNNFKAIAKSDTMANNTQNAALNGPLNLVNLN